MQAADRRIAALEAERKKPKGTLSKPERDSLDTERKAMNRRKGVAEDLVTVAGLERDAASKARDAAIARQHALEMEGLFLRKRKESGDNATSNTGAERPSGSWVARRWWRKSRRPGSTGTWRPSGRWWRASGSTCSSPTWSSRSLEER